MFLNVGNAFLTLKLSTVIGYRLAYNSQLPLRSRVPLATPSAFSILNSQLYKLPLNSQLSTLSRRGVGGEALLPRLQISIGEQVFMEYRFFSFLSLFPVIL